MPSVDLYSHSTNPSPAQLIKVCDDLLSKLVFNQSKPPAVEFLKDAEALAEQILGHYESLSSLAEELRGLASPNSKLPYQVLNVLMYAGVREHASFAEIIMQLDDLYGDEKDQRALAAMSGLTQDNYLMMVPKPTLWGDDGRLKYSPRMFCHMHRNTYIRELSGFFAQGEEGVRKILADYAQMDEASRTMLDEDLSKRVYRSLLPDDHPTRWLLKDKLDDVRDGRTRFEKLFLCVDHADVKGGFEDRLEHAFSLLESLDKRQADEVLKGISTCIREWMTDQSGTVRNLSDEPDLVVPRLVRVLERARPLGFEALPEVAQHTLSDTKQSPKLHIEYILDGGFRDEWENLPPEAAWAEAAVFACDESYLLSLGLSEKHLAILSAQKGTPGLRQALQKQTRGAKSSSAKIWGFDMNIPDFKAIDPKSLKEQILLTCEQFDTYAYGQSSSSVMRLAHPLAEQILAQYGTLRKATEALADQGTGELLPKSVRLLFASAVMYPHLTLGILMDELASLYGRKNHHELAFALARARNQPWAKNLPDIQLFDAQGTMQYQPLAFRIIHPQKFKDEVSFLFFQGEAGIKLILSHYPQMSAGSRQIMDLELGRRVYERMPGDDDGLRELLKDKLNPVQEAQVRIEKMMNQEITSEPDDYFMKWHNLAFDQIDTLSPEGATQAITKLTQCVERHVLIEGDDAELTNEVEPVQCMIQVLKRAMPHGFKVLPIIGKALELDPESPEFFRKLIDFQMIPRDYETSRSIWMEASLVALDEDKVISMNLEPEQLGWLARTTGSAKYRVELKKSSRGREIVFGQDLGL